MPIPPRPPLKKWELMVHQSVTRLAARGGATMLLGQGGKVVVQTLSLVLLARILSPTDYGRFAEILAVVGIATVLSDGGLSLAALRATHLTQQQRSNLFWANTLAGAVLAAAVMLVAVPLAAFYRDPTLVPLTQAVSVVFLLAGVQTQFRAHVNAELHFKQLAATDVVAALIGLGAGIAAAIAHLGTWSLLIQQIVIGTTSLALMIWAARWCPTLPRRTAGMRELYTFGLNSLANQLLNYLSVNAASILLGRIGGASQLGFYTRAYSLFTLPMMQLASPMTRVALPILSRDLGRETLGRRLVKAQTVLSWALVAIFLVLAGSASSFVTVVFGAKWAPSVPMFQLLAVGGVFQAIGYVYYWAFLVTANTRTQLRIVAPARLLMVALAFPLSFLGGTGVAASVAAGLFLIWLVSSTIGMRAVGLAAGPLIRAAIRPCAVFSAASLAELGLHGLLAGALPAPVELALSLALSVLVVAVAAVVVRSVRRDLTLVATTARAALSRNHRGDGVDPAAGDVAITATAPRSDRGAETSPICVVQDRVSLADA